MAGPTAAVINKRRSDAVELLESCGPAVQTTHPFCFGTGVCLGSLCDTEFHAPRTLKETQGITEGKLSARRQHSLSKVGRAGPSATSRLKCPYQAGVVGEPAELARITGQGCGRGRGRGRWEREQTLECVQVYKERPTNTLPPWPP